MQIILKAIIKKEDKFLTILRSKNAKFFPGYWDFPGGKLEKDEDAEKGIKREVFEEVSLNIKVKKLLEIYEIDLKYKTKKIPHKFMIYDTDM